MRHVHILVEGQTEETFVSEVLAPHLWNFNIHINPVLLNTGTGKGGVSKYARIRRDVLLLLQDSSAAAVSTMLDFYGLPDDFPGLHTLLAQCSALKKVQTAEQAFANDVSDARFIPFLTLHEFEAFLFVDIERLFEIVAVSSDCQRKLKAIAQAVSTPEEINDTPSGHPSQRIKSCIPGFSKLLHGIPCVRTIGLERIRLKCPHFSEWLSRLEQLP